MSTKTKRKAFLEKLQNVVYIVGVWENNELRDYFLDMRGPEIFKTEEKAKAELAKWKSKGKFQNFEVRPVKWNKCKHIFYE